MSFSSQEFPFSAPILNQGYGASASIYESLHPELRKVLDFEIENGNVVLDVQHWSPTEPNYIIVMRAPLSFDRIQELDIPPDSLERYECWDGHYTIGEGFSAVSKAQTIQGPFRAETLRARERKGNIIARNAGLLFLCGLFAIGSTVLILLWAIVNTIGKF